AAARLAWSLPGYLRRRLDLELARKLVRQRLQDRPNAFLEVLRTQVLSAPTNPYRQLLRAAGCELGDVEVLLRHDGLEAALIALQRAGVYLTVDELKGRKPVTRGSLTLSINPALLR